MSTIKPELPGGFKDYLPKDQIKKEKIIDIIKGVFCRFGFVPLDTPAVEKRKILTGGDPAFNKQIFDIKRSTAKLEKAGKSGRDELSLRFDLTVPLARVVSAYPQDIEKPFKRYQIGKVWRGENPQLGRYREFMQCDADIVGSVDLISDAEIIALIFDTLSSLGVKKFKIKINNRKVLNGLPGVENSNKKEDVLRALDRLAKEEWETVAGELEELGIKKEDADKVKSFISVSGKDNEKKIKQAREVLENIVSLKGLDELEGVLGYLDSYGIPENVVKVDFSIARGLGYYTGTVMETFLDEAPEVGSVFSGGRYDGLVKRFSGTEISAVGASVGLDRLFSVMDKVSDFEYGVQRVQVVVLNFDDKTKNDVIKAATSLRRENISAEIYLGMENNIKGQLAYALKKEASAVVIIGEEEKSKKTARVKDLKSRKQFEVSLGNLTEKVKEILNG